MAIIEKLDKTDNFKIKNLKNWNNVSKFWITNSLSQKKDLTEFMQDKLKNVFQKHSNKRIKILDVGCGEGWLIDIIKQTGFDFDYTGIDFNENFVKYLNQKYKNETRFKFICEDIESLKLNLNSFDVIINSFSLFEMPSYKKVLKNEYSALSLNGNIIITSIHPLTQLFAISDNYEELLYNQKMYAKYGSEGFYVKQIDTGNGFVSHKYFGILHTMVDYIQVLKELNMIIVDYIENNMLDANVPKIYEYLNLVKKV